MKVMCVLLLLSVAVVYEAEAGWWRKATDFIGKIAWGVVKFFGKKERRRRELVEDLDAETAKKVDKFCSENHMNALTKDGLPLEMVIATFRQINKNGKSGVNDALNLAELDEFLNAVDIYKHCMKKKEEKKGKTA